MKSLLRKEMICEVREVEGQPRTLRFVGSDETEDRGGEVISVAGWALKNYRKNPVFLFAHDYRSLPIGQATKVAKEDGRLTFDIKFADRETYPFADTVFQLYKQKFLRATSVGFLPTKEIIETVDEQGNVVDDSVDVADLKGVHRRRRYLKQELLELSAVPVPANPNALLLAVEKGIITADEAELQKSGCPLPTLEVKTVGDETDVTLIPPAKDAKDVDLTPPEKNDLDLECDGEFCQVDGITIKGEALAALLNRRINAMTNDETSRADIIARMATAAGISPGTVNEILRGKINCPPLSRLAGFARVLGISVGSMRAAGERDGCDYGERSTDGATEKRVIQSKIDALIASVELLIKKVDELKNNKALEANPSGEGSEPTSPASGDCYMDEVLDLAKDVAGLFPAKGE